MQKPKGSYWSMPLGNDNVNIDEVFSYPNDNFQNEPEVSSNFITIGAIGPVKNPLMIAPFSNYGKYNLDLFAPGAVIYAPVPSNQYEALSGTSDGRPIGFGSCRLNSVLLSKAIAQSL